MPDLKITGLTADTTPTSDDLIPTVNDPAGTPANRKVTLANAITKAHGLSDSTVVGVASGVLTSGTDVAVVDGGTGASSASGARTNLGLVIGTDVQAYDADLATLSTAFSSASASGPASLAFHEDTDNGTNKITVQGVASVTSDKVLTLPDATDTLVGKATTDVLTNKSIDADTNTITNIENADIKAAAAIALNKLAATTVSRALVSDGSGFVSPATTTSTEIGYVNGVTSAIQTQIDGKQPLDSDLTTIAGLTATTNNIIQSVSSAWASRTPTQVTATLIDMVGDSGSGGTKGLVPAPAAGDAAANKFLKADGTWAAGAAGSVATDAIWDAKGDLAGGTGANTAARLAVGTDGQVLTADSAETTGMKWATVAGSGDVSKVGTPVNNQVGVWTGDGTLEGDADLTFDTATNTLAIGTGVLTVDTLTLTGTGTLNGVDAIDATTEATIEAAIDTLANLTSIQGRTVTLADAGADALLGWDDSASAYQNLSAADAIAALGVTSTATELNYTDGVTSAIQTQLDARLPLAGGTMTGNITLAENASIALDPAGSADGKYTGTTVTGTGGATIAFGDLVTLDKDDSRWELVDISVAAAATGDARGLLGMAVTSSTDGAAITVLLNGIIRADANFPALTIGAEVFASTTGDITSTQPTTVDYVIRRVGAALTADEIYFNPSYLWYTHT